MIFNLIGEDVQPNTKLFNCDTKDFIEDLSVKKKIHLFLQLDDFHPSQLPNEKHDKLETSNDFCNFIIIPHSYNDWKMRKNLIFMWQFLILDAVS